MEKINIAELLKNCPKGMELDCIIFNNPVKYESANDDGSYPISIRTEEGELFYLNKYGCLYDRFDSKCAIFPKGKTTWEGFVPPCKFNDGDVIFTHTNALKCNLDNNWVSIFKEYRNNRCACYVCLCLSDLELYHDKWEDELLCELCEIEESRLATEEEKEKLFDAIKANGYRWNEETKTLEKLVSPNFKVGNKIIRKGRKGIDYPIEVLAIENGMYKLPAMSMPVDSQDEWELVPDKFDINTLKIFESKVLVRSGKHENWRPAMFGGIEIESHDPYVTVGGSYFKYLIPYEGNEHLTLSKNDCDDFYKTWE